MLDNFADWILGVVNSVPISFGASPPQAAAIRAVAAVLLLILIIYILAMRGSIFKKLIRPRREREPPN
jgi:hypothetical protein